MISDRRQCSRPLWTPLFDSTFYGECADTRPWIRRRNIPPSKTTHQFIARLQSFFTASWYARVQWILSISIILRNCQVKTDSTLWYCWQLTGKKVIFRFGNMNLHGRSIFRVDSAALPLIRICITTKVARCVADRGSTAAVPRSPTSCVFKSYGIIVSKS